MFGNMSDSFELVEGMEELYFGADQVSIPGFFSCIAERARSIVGQLLET